MLVFANGAVKSGSTWLFHIARELTGFRPPPVRYANPKWQSQPVYSIDQTRLVAFLDDAEVGALDVLTKNHFGARSDRDLLLTHPQVRVLNIRRDIRDVVISAYHHQGAGQPAAGDFSTYYWQNGRHVVQNVLDYQIVWDVRSPRYLCIAYETLLADFTGEVGRVAHFLGLAPTPAGLEQVQQATSPATLNARYPFSDFNRFYSGTVGNWQNYFDAAIVVDMAALIKRSRRPLHRLALVGPRGVRRLCRPWRDLTSMPSDGKHP